MSDFDKYPFLKELRDLCKKYNAELTSCGCCKSITGHFLSVDDAPVTEMHFHSLQIDQKFGNIVTVYDNAIKEKCYGKQI